MFEIWYCPEYPVGAINYSNAVYRSDWDYYRPGLLEHMKEHGLINPLILLNHRDPNRYKERWLKVGNNRMWAIKELGWKKVPVIITGDCPHEPKEKVDPDKLESYFRDGYPVIKEEGEGSIEMAGHSLPEELEHPTVTGGYREVHDDDSAA